MREAIVDYMVSHGRVYVDLMSLRSGVLDRQLAAFASIHSSEVSYGLWRPDIQQCSACMRRVMDIAHGYGSNESGAST